MPWSIFSDGGGAGAALTWARDLLTRIGAPQTPGNVQVIYDWEVSEGGGGKFNPLNQGPVSYDPSLTSTGPQYGGGAADYVSWAAGLQGAADYLAMPNFSAIRADLVAGDPAQARADIIASPWAASHYGYGAGFSGSPVPGKAAALPSAAAAGDSQAADSGTSSADPLTTIASGLKTLAYVAPLVVAGGALIVLGFVKATGLKPPKAVPL